MKSLIFYLLKSVAMLCTVELLHSLNNVAEFEFSIDGLNALLFETMALWLLLQLSFETALFLAVISARKIGEILAFSST